MAASVEGYADALLLDAILPGIIEREQTNSVFQARLQRNSKDIKGDYIVSKTEIRGEQGMGSLNRGENYPAASEGGYLNAIARIKRMYGTLECWDEDRILSKGKSTEAVESIVLRKGYSFMKNWAIDQARIIWGNSSGELGKVDGDQSSVTTIKVNKVQYFQRGQIIDIHESSVIEDRTITSKSPKNSTITISGAAVNVTDATVITRANAKDKEMVGLQWAVSDGLNEDGWDESAYAVYEDVSRLTDEEWASYVVRGKGEAFSLDRLDDMVLKAIHDYGSNPSAFYVDLIALQSIIYLCKKKGLTLGLTKIELGYESPTYVTPKGNIPLIVEPPIPEKSVYLLQEDTINLRQPYKAQFVPGLRGEWSPHPDKPMDYAHFEYLAEIYCREPWKNAKYVDFVSALGT